MEQTTQKIVEETAKMSDGMLFAMAGGMITAAGVVFKFVFGRLDKKMDKETFKAFEKGNDEAHQRTHNALERIEGKMG